MIALLRLVLAVLAAPFKSKSRLEAENAALRHQVVVLRRKVHGRVRLTTNDRWLCLADFISIAGLGFRYTHEIKIALQRNA
jgi:hypothetical protein